MVSVSHRLTEGTDHQIYVTGGLSFPTGSIDEKGDTPRGKGTQVPYTMQIGSGTYDLQPALVYLGQNDQEHIFEPFYTRKIMGRSGSGLGLAVVYGVLKDLGGYIDLTSTKGKGSVFSFYFPISVRQTPFQANAPQPMAGTERILIIDDVPEQRQLGGRVLTSLGYHVDTAINGREGLVNAIRNVLETV